MFYKKNSDYMTRSEFDRGIKKVVDHINKNIEEMMKKSAVEVAELTTEEFKKEVERINLFLMEQTSKIVGDEVHKELIKALDKLNKENLQMLAKVEIMLNSLKKMKT